VVSAARAYIPHVDVTLVGKRGSHVLLRDRALSHLGAEYQLNREEFALGMYLLQLARTGKEIPKILPSELVPPSRRRADSLGMCYVPRAYVFFLCYVLCVMCYVLCVMCYVLCAMYPCVCGHLLECLVMI